LDYATRYSSYIFFSWCFSEQFDLLIIDEASQCDISSLIYSLQNV
jgi:superfamily I DNA and/or RNA helicase